MRRTRTGRLFLVAAVILGLIGMHALVAPAADAGPPPSHPVVTAPATPGHGEHGGGHGGAEHALHLCLAVLLGIVVLLAAAFLLVTGVPAVPVPRVARPRGAPAGRPPPVPRRLAVLCVLRT